MLSLEKKKSLDPPYWPENHTTASISFGSTCSPLPCSPPSVTQSAIGLQGDGIGTSSGPACLKTASQETLSSKWAVLGTLAFPSCPGWGVLLVKYSWITFLATNCHSRIFGQFIKKKNVLLASPRSYMNRNYWWIYTSCKLQLCNIANLAWMKSVNHFTKSQQKLWRHNSSLLTRARRTMTFSNARKGASLMLPQANISLCYDDKYLGLIWCW